MRLKRLLLITSIVKPFYRENAGLLCFVYYIMFLAVGAANGVGMLDYHYSLIRGMLNYPSILLLVYAAWFVYALRCSQFVNRTLKKPEFSYLYLLPLLHARNIFLLLLQIQVLIFLPVLSYLVIIVVIGYQEQWYLITTLTLVFNILLCLTSTGYYQYLLLRPGKVSSRIRWRLPSVLQRKYYVSFLIRYVLENGKLVFLAIKVYTCGILYLVLEGRNPATETDMRMFVFFYFVGLLGHGILIHRLKETENTRMTFYRLLPVPVSQRFATYAFFYLLLFIPEIVTIASRTPLSLRYAEAAFLILFGYGTLLLLNSLQLFNYTGIKSYFKTVMQVFVMFILALIAGWQREFALLVFIVSIVLFFARYYRFEAQPNNVMR